MSQGVRYDESTGEWVSLLRELIEGEQEFVMAVVVSVRGSAAAKVGAKGAILPDGRVLGWLGGWCSENAVTLAALETLKTGRPRLIRLVMAGRELRKVEEDVIEVGTPCGGEVLLYVEPVYPKPQIVVFGHNRVVKALVSIGRVLGFKTVVVDPGATSEDYPEADRVLQDLEALSKLRLDRHTYPVLATIGRTELDLAALERLLPTTTPRIFLVSSVNRAEEILRTLARRGFPSEQLEKIETPAGIDIGATTPEELALSVLAGIVAYRRGGKSVPMRQTRGDPLSKVLAEARRRGKPGG